MLERIVLPNSFLAIFRNARIAVFGALGAAARRPIRAVSRGIIGIRYAVAKHDAIRALLASIHVRWYGTDMNAVVRIDDCDFAPALLTGEDVLAMTQAGILPEGRGYELIEGVLVHMAAQYSPHVRMVRKLVRKLGKLLTEDIAVAPAPSIFLSTNTMLEPDICLYPDAMESLDVRGPDLALVIEVADTTIRSDLGKKAKIYAAHGVTHYWVIDLNAEILHRFTQPDAEGYGSKVESGFGEVVAVPVDGTPTITLADL